jgi:hypothetical protein
MVYDRNRMYVDSHQCVPTSVFQALIVGGGLSPQENIQSVSSPEKYLKNSRKITNIKKCSFDITMNDLQSSGMSKYHSLFIKLFFSMEFSNR